MSESFLRLPDVMSRTGLRRSSIYAMMSQGQFPKSVKLGARCVAWTESDVSAWIQRRINIARLSAATAISSKKNSEIC